MPKHASAATPAGAARGGAAWHQRGPARDAHGALAVGDVVGFAGNGHDRLVGRGDGPCGLLGLGHGVARVHAFARALATCQRDDLRGVAADDGRAQGQEALDGVAAEGGGVVGHRIQHPGDACLAGGVRGQQHAFQPGRRQRADIDDHRAGDLCELRRVVRGVHHGGRRAHRQQHVGREVHGDEIGQALHQRGVAAAGRIQVLRRPG
ncbi:hypothetical protein G6F31_017981 [Rhizopus arrhizus]|nr:hypothetical protein G6F31_017981 [Rhizopus arrhizus]